METAVKDPEDPAPEPEPDETQAIVNAAVEASMKGLDERLAKLTQPDRAKVAQTVYAGEAKSGETFMKALDAEIEVSKRWGRELHTCADPDCTNRDHGIRAAHLILRIAANRNDYQKATGGLLEGTNAVGGYLVPVDYHQDLIPLLRAKAVVRGIGTPVYPMPELITYIPRQSGGGTGGWRAEVGAMTASNQALEQVPLTAKSAYAMTFFSNELLRDSTPQADMMVRDDLIRVLALTEDKAFLLGGSQDTGSPVGIWQHTGSTSYTVTTGAGTYDNGTAAPSYATFVNLRGKLLAGNSNFQNCAWVMNARDFTSTELLTDATGQPLFRDAFSLGQTRVLGGPAYSPGNILGYPVYISNQMPTNISSVRSGIIFGDFSEAVIGERQGLEVDTTSEATVIDPDGSTAVNLWSTNQSAIRVTERVDFVLRHPAGFAVATNVTT